MGHEYNISNLTVHRTPTVDKSAGAQDTDVSPNSPLPSASPKENSGTLFMRQWQNGQANELRTLLNMLLPDGDVPSGDMPIFSRENSSTLIPQSSTEQLMNLLTQDLETLIGSAQNHPDFQSFQNQPMGFWDNVRQISEIRIVETYVNGKLTPRAESDYGRMLGQLDRQGGNLQSFVASLPTDEGKVFEARYQINQTFGANDLFIGKGITLDKNGQLPVRTFMASNNASLDLPPHSVLSLAHEVSSKPGFFKNIPLFMSGQVLLTAKSAALLSLSLALYQNTDARISLGDLDLPTVPRAFNQAIEQPAGRIIVNQNFEKAETNLLPKNDPLLTGVLVNGDLPPFDKYSKYKRQQIDAWTGGDTSATNFGFSVGATGAMMGATIGCIVPLAEKNVSEITGFAAGVVAGLTNAEVKSHSANTMISAIESGVQKILDAAGGNQKRLSAGAANKLLNPATSTANDLRQKLFNQRMKMLLSS